MVMPRAVTSMVISPAYHTAARCLGRWRGRGQLAEDKARDGDHGWLPGGCGNRRGPAGRGRRSTTMGDAQRAARNVGRRAGGAPGPADLLRRGPAGPGLLRPAADLALGPLRAGAVDRRRAG